MIKFQELEEVQTLTRSGKYKNLLYGLIIGFLGSSLHHELYSDHVSIDAVLDANTMVKVSYNPTVQSDDVGDVIIPIEKDDRLDEEAIPIEKDDRLDEEAKRLETAVIMVTGLLPTHPSIWVLEKALNAMWSNLEGLHPQTNVYITVDAPADLDKDKLERLDQYTQALHRRFSGEENRHVKIIVNSVNRHVNGSLRKVVFDQIDTNVTKYIYVLQHDLIFMPGKIINHTAIVNAFDKYYEKKIVQIVGFAKDKNARNVHGGGGVCQERADLGWENPLKIYEGESNKSDTAIYFTHSGYWSDQNHFTTVQYYRDVLTRMGPVPRFPEGPMMNAAARNCTEFGEHWYGLPTDGQYICHLDHKKAYRNGNCPDSFWDYGNTTNTTINA